MGKDNRFRAWDEDTKQMLPVVDLSAPKSEHKWLGTKDIALMQFTGLKDKNGVEIYEGDVVEHAFDDVETDEAEYEKGRPFVMFDYGCFRYKYAHWTENEIGLPLGDSSHYLIVIGNIYENPELLEVTP